MSHRIITIGREFGSGGRTIGREVAQRLGIPCYDQELIQRLAEESGLSEEFIRNESEDASHSSWTAVAFSAVRTMNVPSNQDYLWGIQRRIILELGEKEDCVIVGRCADAILEDTDVRLLKVFIHADFASRARRIVDKYGETDEPTEKRLRDKDKRRALYYQFYTDKEWGSVDNYHVILDSGKLGIETCVNVICSLY
jgi:cytidylate kinase